MRASALFLFLTPIRTKVIIMKVKIETKNNRLKFTVNFPITKEAASFVQTRCGYSSTAADLFQYNFYDYKVNKYRETTWKSRLRPCNPFYEEE